MRSLLLLPLLAAIPLSLAFGEEEGENKPIVVEVSLEKIATARPRFCVYGEENLLEEGKAVPVGAYRVVLRVNRGKQVLAWTQNGRERVARLREDKKNQVISVGAGRDRRKVLIHRDLFGRLYWQNSEALAGRLLGHHVVFMDRNFDGRHLDVGADGFGILEASHIVPLRPPIILGSREIELLEVGDRQRKASFRVKELGGRLSAESRLSFGVLNDIRLSYGLLPARLNEEMSLRYCKKHVEWMVRNSVQEHRETPGSPGYSADGNTGGVNSLIHAEGGAIGLFTLFDTPLHGYEMGCPSFTRTALYSEGYIAVWYTQNHGMSWPETNARWPAVFPPHGARGVPVSWWDESPDPREGNPRVDWGYPIRIYLDAGGMCRGPYPTEFKVSLRQLGARSPEPVQSVYDPTSATGPNPKTVEVVVLPRNVLKPNTIYTLEMSWNLGGKANEWNSSFRTGSQRGQFRSSLEFD